jgi:hypothetical protein
MQCFQAEEKDIQIADVSNKAHNCSFVTCYISCFLKDRKPLVQGEFNPKFGESFQLVETETLSCQYNHDFPTNYKVEFSCTIFALRNFQFSR